MDPIGIILAGGKGTRLHPITYTNSKQLQPVFDKPMIYYPMSTLFSMGINDIHLISTEEHLPTYEKLFGSGRQLGATITYEAQPEPEGIAQAFMLPKSKERIKHRPSVLILGDNIFDVNRSVLRNALAANAGATIFAFEVEDPSSYGVVVLDEQGRPTDLVEKPKTPVSNLAIPGLYLYDEQVTAVAKDLQKSARNEYEITDLNRCYLRSGMLRVVELERPMGWFDAGTHTRLLEVSAYVHATQSRNCQGIGMIEEAAYLSDCITLDQLVELHRAMLPPGATSGSEYADFLAKRIKTFRTFGKRKLAK